MNELFPQPDRDRKGKQPCGECHIQPGEVCDICGTTGRSVAIQRLADEVKADEATGVQPNDYSCDKATNRAKKR